MMKLLFMVFIASILSTLTSGQLVIPGGKQKISVNDEMLQAAMANAAVQINQRLVATQYLSFVSKIYDASAQIVEGVRYEVSFELGESTSCLKGHIYKTYDTCYPLRHQKLCHVTILAKTWLDPAYTLEKFYCDPVMVKREEVESPEGGIEVIDTENAELHAALMALEGEMSDRFDSEYVSQVGKVLEAKSQVVEGVNYFLTFKFGQTYRLKSKQHEEAPPHRRSEVIRKMETCSAEIWDRVWVKPRYQLTSFKCEKTASSGQFYAGGFHAIEVTNKDMLAALHAVQDQISIRLELQAGDFGQVLKAEAQVVSGMKYAITFEFDHRVCQATIWTQSWLNRNELEGLSCGNKQH